MKRSSALPLAALITVIPAAATAASLTIANVSAPAINCVFNTTCKITVSDTVGQIPVPGIAGKAILQSRTFTAGKGAPGAGKRGYIYRVDLTQAVGVVNIACVSALKLDFGPVSKLQYDGAGPLDDVFVITGGGLGTIGLSTADKIGNVITFTFAKPVWAGGSVGKGDTTYFFGLAATTAPKNITAQVQVTGGPLVNVPARVPTH